MIKVISVELSSALIRHLYHPSAGSTSGRPSGGGSEVLLIALAPPIPSASSFSCTRRNTSGSGEGSTFLGATRGQSLHFSCPHFWQVNSVGLNLVWQLWQEYRTFRRGLVYVRVALCESATSKSSPDPGASPG
jgi:hypothetical protein